MSKEFEQTFALAPDRKRRSHKFFTFRSIGLPNNHLSYYQRDDKLVLVGQEYDTEVKPAELERWAEEHDAGYLIAPEWTLHFPGASILVMVELTPPPAARPAQWRRPGW